MNTIIYVSTTYLFSVVLAYMIVFIIYSFQHFMVPYFKSVYTVITDGEYGIF